MSQVRTISIKYAYLCRSNFSDFRLQQPSLVHGDTKLYKAFSDGIHNRVDSKKATIMHAKLLEGAKIKTANQEVTASLIPPVGEAKTVTSSEFPAYRGTNMEFI